MAQKVLYSKLFTPPKFLVMPSVSLEILPEGISFLLEKSTDRGLLPEMSGLIPLPVGTISKGEIVKKDNVIKALIEIRKKTKVGFVRFSLPEEKTYIFKTTLPKLAPKEIREILDFKIEENVPLSAKEAVFDYDILPHLRGTDEIDVVVSVAPLKTVEELQLIFETAGLTPIFFSPESSSVARAVIRESNEQVIVVVNIRESNIVLSLVIHGVVCQTSSLNFGSSVFTDLLAKYFKVSLEEALKIKKEKLYSENPDNMEIFSYLINTISAIKDEIYKFISYCNEREDVDGQVDKIILCGRDALIVGFDKYLSLNLNMNVSVANIWVNNFNFDDYTPEISRLDSLDLAVVNGLSLF
jgi:type IV pilus assembly protein PilM